MAIEKCLKKRQERISLDELIKLFAKKSGTNTLRRCYSAGTLMKNIKMPTNSKDVSTILPASRYAKKQLKINPEDQYKTLKTPYILDRFIKEKGPTLNRQRRLNNKVYAQSEENLLKPSKSEVLIGDKQVKRKQ